MKKRIRNLINLWLSSFSIVFLLTFNIWVVSREMYFMACISSFFIGLLWTFNVKFICDGSWPERIIYCFGSLVGTIVGLLFCKFLQSL
jgi:hypothetical protein